MKILLVYPEFPDTFWSFKHALKFIRKKAALAAAGPADRGRHAARRTGSKRLVDLNVRTLTHAGPGLGRLRLRQRHDRPARVGAAAHRPLQARPACKVVAGGPLFTGEHEQFPEVDHFVLNEAELTLPPFLADLAAGRRSASTRTTEFADIQPDARSRCGSWSTCRRYATMSIQYSRGCPFNCDFCNVTALLGHRPRTKTAAQIIAELDGLYALGWRGDVFFVDDNFIGNKRQLKAELLPALIEWRKGKRGMPFNTEASINLADDAELMQLMVEAGFDTVFVGIETPDEDSLAECSKTRTATATWWET